MLPLSLVPSWVFDWNGANFNDKIVALNIDISKMVILLLVTGQALNIHYFPLHILQTKDRETPKYFAILA